MSQTATHPHMSLRPVRVLVTLGTTLALLLSAGCSDDSPSSAPDRNSSSGNPSSESPEPPAPEPWVEISDKDTGVKFMFPEKVKPARKPKTMPDGSKAVAKGYAASADGVSMSVSIITSDGDLSALDGQTVLNAMVNGLNRAGSKDTTLSKVHAAGVRGDGSATDGTITFVSKQDQPAYWRLRIVGSDDGHMLVYIQALTNAGPEQKQARKLVDGAFDRLVDSFSL